jgi:hypothetical protein
MIVWTFYILVFTPLAVGFLHIAPVAPTIYSHNLNLITHSQPSVHVLPGLPCSTRSTIHHIIPPVIELYQW